MDERIEEVLHEARAIIAGIEEGTAKLSRIALRARRLAQLVEDEENYLWLRLECEGGFPQRPFEREWKAPERAAGGLQKFMALRSSPDWHKVGPDAITKAAREGVPLPRESVLAGPLSQIEASLSQELWPKELRDTAYRDMSVFQQIAATDLVQSHTRQVLELAASAIHEWASNIYITYRFRDLTADVFQQFKTNTEIVLSELCPDAISKLNHAVERLVSSDPEQWSAAALSCRRALKDFADKVYPASDATVEGRKVGDSEYKNRLWAFAKERGAQKLKAQALALQEIDGLCATLDRVYELASKGAHAEITAEEARLCVLRTYVLFAQLAQLVLPSD